MALYFLSGVGALLIFLVIAKLLSLKKIGDDRFLRVLKAFGLITALLFTFRYMMGDLYIEDKYITYLFSIGQGLEGFSSLSHAIFSSVLVWINVTAILMVILYPFFKSVKTLKFLTAFVCPVILVVNFACLENLLLANFGLEIYEFSTRGLLFSLELGFAIGISVIALIDYLKNIKIEDYKINKSLVLCVVFSFLGMLLATCPNYFPQIVINVFSSIRDNVEDLNLYHRIYIYPAIIIPIVLYVLLKDRSYDTKRFSMIYYALAGLYLYSLTHKFADFAYINDAGQFIVNVSNLPFHLCNTALYVTPACLIFKAKKVFYFTYFINVLGAFLAIAMPDYNLEGINGTMFVHDTVLFFRSHYQAFFMPLLVVGLGIFKRPRMKEFKYSLVGFAGYYLFVLIVNGWFTNYDPDIDYFFINSDFIADKLGSWAVALRNLTWEFDINGLHFKYYPIYQSLYFTVYIIMSLGMWFLYELGYDVAMGWHDIANRNKVYKMDKLALEVKLNGRDKGEPVDMESTNKLILKNFTKRYGTSDVYAVKDACLEVTGGEVFGFLGPNGAGKSTIIKSIVGIQTITDGAISVCGYDVKTQAVGAKSQIGFVPDHYALYEKLTAREYVNYIADLYEVPKDVREERLNGFIKQFEFESAIDNPIRTYSHGMKQKVTIMAALIHDPKVWILDEPLTGLDPNSIFQVKECMKNHAKKGNIVFFSSHIIDVVEKICDKIAIIRKGQIQCVKTIEEIEREDTLENFYMSVINGKEVAPIKVAKQTAEEV